MSKKRRININIEGDDVSDLEAIDLVHYAIEYGRVSGNNDTYCYHMHSSFTGLSLYSRRTKSGNDTFTIWRSVPNENDVTESLLT